MDEFSADDLLLHRAIAGLDGGPSHDRVIAIVARARSDTHYESRIWRFFAHDGAPPAPITSPQFDASSAVLDPEGRRVAFLSARDGAKRVHVLSLDGGEAAAIGDARLRTTGILAWSPDGARLLVLDEAGWPGSGDGPDAGDGDRPVVVDFLPYKLEGTGFVVARRVGLLELDVRSGRACPLVRGDFDVADAAWSPDGQRLAYIRHRDGRQRHRTDLWLADRDGARPLQVTHDLPAVQGLAWSPDGRWLAFAGSCREGDSILTPWLLDARGGGRLSRPAGDLELEGARFVWDSGSSRVATIAAHRGLFRIAVVEAAGGCALLDTGQRHVLALAATRERLAFVAAAMDDACEVRSIAWDGADARRHSALNRDWFRARRRPRVDLRAFEVPDGDDGSERIDAWILRPPEGDGPWPVLVDMHGGPQSVALIDFAAHAYWYDLVARGWMIVAPNAVGSGSYGGKFVHQMSGSPGPFVALNCGALPPELLASQLFGHERGSFTGALSRHIGVFEQAAHGTLFLDEITEMPIEQQVYLLRVLETGAVRRLGSTDETPAPVRILAATNRCPQHAVADGRLREDLYYRLSDFTIALPPLRMRDDDVILLAEHFIGLFNAGEDMRKRLSPAARRTLRHYPWPGNVRELRSATYRACVLAAGDDVVVQPGPSRQPRPLETENSIVFTVGTPWSELEQRSLLKVLAHCGNDKTAAARMLGISVRTVHNHLARMQDGDGAAAR